MQYDKRWAFVDEDSDLDEERTSARNEAAELREQANSLTGYADGLPEGRERADRLREALSMYTRAETCIMSQAAGRSLQAEDRDLVLQCRLNAACLAVQVGDENVVESMCKGAMELDDGNPHVALFQARLARMRNQPATVKHWLQRARNAAQQRGDKDVLKQVAAMQPAPTAATSEPPNLNRWVEEGVALLKQRRLADAQDMLERAVSFLDRDVSGGPIERLAARAPRALAFDALEALAEIHASQHEWQEAILCGQRAVSLIEDGEFEPLFSKPEIHRREGLLCISMGHVTAAAGGDPLPTWRRAVHALCDHGGDAMSAGHALLKVGVWLADHAAPKEGAEPLAEAIYEGVTALEHAINCFKKARVRPASEGLSEAAAARRREEAARQELEAQATLVKLLVAIHEEEPAREILEKSAFLLDSASSASGTSPGVAHAWAESCGNWGLQAHKLGCWDYAEQAFSCQRNLGQRAGLQKVEVEALKALSLLHRRRGDEASVQAALDSLRDLLPEDERERVVRQVRSTLAKVQPAAAPTAPASIPAAPVKSTADPADQSKEQESIGSNAARCLSWATRSRCAGAVACGLVSIILGIMMQQSSIALQAESPMV